MENNMKDNIEQREKETTIIIIKLLTDMILDKDEIISLLKEKIERLENENIGLQQQRKK